MSQTEKQQFAYGANTFDGCPCPATAAGYHPEENRVTAMAERYDTVLQQSPSDNGTVNEQLAKEAWLEALDYWKQTHHERTQSEYCAEHAIEQSEYAIEIGETIAKELGWL